MPPSDFTEATTEMPALGVPTPLIVGVASDACAACGVGLAPDQRYCVECGQPRGAPRLPASVGGATVARVSSRMSANTALIAGIGTLLLAMGIGVFIGSQGRSDSTGSAPPAPQTVTVVTQGSGGAASAAGAPAAAATTTTPTTTSPAGPGAAKKATAKTAAPAVPKKPTPPVVHVGSPGTGPGYTNGKVTGNFF
jgi:hypothetical protein